MIVALFIVVRFLFIMTQNEILEVCLLMCRSVTKLFLYEKIYGVTITVTLSLEDIFVIMKTKEPMDLRSIRYTMLLSQPYNHMLIPKMLYGIFMECLNVGRHNRKAWQQSNSICPTALKGCKSKGREENPQKIVLIDTSSNPNTIHELISYYRI